MAATVWKDFISFGLVSIPVRLYSGARGKTVNFHLLHQKDHSRVHEVMYCSAEEKPVERSELVKGYEYQKGTYVVVTPEEIKAVTPPTSKVFKPHKDLVNDKELKLANLLIESLVDKFKPEKYKDTFRENLKKLMEKAKGKEIKPVPEPRVSKVVDIMEALRRSLEARKPVQRERAPANKAPRRKRA